MRTIKNSNLPWSWGISISINIFNKRYNTIKSHLLNKSSFLWPDIAPVKNSYWQENHLSTFRYIRKFSHSFIVFSEEFLHQWNFSHQVLLSYYETLMNLKIIAYLPFISITFGCFVYLKITVLIVARSLGEKNESSQLHRPNKTEMDWKCLLKLLVLLEKCFNSPRDFLFFCFILLQMLCLQVFQNGLWS